MYVSLNELSAALRRCFEANDYSVGQYEDAAASIVWLEQHGCRGLDELYRSLPFLDADQVKPESQISYEDATSLVLECTGRSALNCVAAAVDLVQVKAQHAGIATLTLHNCHNRMVVLKALTDCGRRGMSVVAYWQNGSTVITEHTAAIRAGERYPHYSQVELAGEALQEALASDNRQSLTLLCTRQLDLTSSLRNRQQGKGLLEMTPQQLEANAAATLDQGVNIDDQLWDSIYSIGNGVLVENSESSRQGAGE